MHESANFLGPEAGVGLPDPAAAEPELKPIARPSSWKKEMWPIWDKMAAGQPLDNKNIYELEGEEKAKIRTVPGSLEESLAALEKDHEFLLKGGVFTQDVIDTWLAYKREAEIDPVRLRPHPHEFYLYFDI